MYISFCIIDLRRVTWTKLTKPKFSVFCPKDLFRGQINSHDNFQTQFFELKKKVYYNSDLLNDNHRDK